MPLFYTNRFKRNYPHKLYGKSPYPIYPLGQDSPTDLTHLLFPQIYATQIDVYCLPPPNIELLNSSKVDSANFQKPIHTVEAIKHALKETKMTSQ